MVDICIFEVESFEQDAADAIKRVVEKILRSQVAPHQYLDREFAFHDDDDDEVEVHLQYVGLIYKDVLAALRYVGSTNELDLEGRGSVRRVGKHVSNLVAGDEMTMVSPGVFRTDFVVDKKHCRKLFSRLLIRDAAGMALAYLTAIYSLDHVGHVQKGQV
ncbi:hypothetical protein AnigIFM56816_000127 [Aspergillus niger]|nr:hypothetical protein AnigIFM56816_000127 [Aspergillus niger]